MKKKILRILKKCIIVLVVLSLAFCVAVGALFLLLDYAYDDELRKLEALVINDDRGPIEVGTVWEEEPFKFVIESVEEVPMENVMEKIVFQSSQARDFEYEMACRVNFSLVPKDDENVGYKFSFFPSARDEERKVVGTFPLSANTGGNVYAKSEYIFLVPEGAEEINMTVNVPYGKDGEKYRMRYVWNVDEIRRLEIIDLPKIGSAVARYTEQLEIINDTLLDTTKAGDRKVVCYVNDIPILQDELSFRTALGFISKYPRTDAELLDVLTEEKVLQSIAIKHGILPTEEQIAQYIQREQQEDSLVRVAEDICESGALSADEYWNLYERYNVIRLLTAQNVYEYYNAEQSMNEEAYRLQMAEWVEQAKVVKCK